MTESLCVESSLGSDSKLAVAFLEYEEIGRACFSLVVYHDNRGSGVCIDDLHIADGATGMTRRDLPCLFE